MNNTTSNLTSTLIHNYNLSNLAAQTLANIFYELYPYITTTLLTEKKWDIHEYDTFELVQALDINTKFYNPILPDGTLDMYYINAITEATSLFVGGLRHPNGDVTYILVDELFI